MSETFSTTRIVRPDLFLAPEVVGITLPSIHSDEGKLTAKWTMALQWRGGNREIRDLQESLPLPAGGQLYFYPMPHSPSPRDIPAWSVDGQQQWLAGISPDLADVFSRVRVAIRDFIDLPAEHEQGTVALLTLWIMFTYVYPAWPAVPYLFITGPLGSGKTRVFDILEQLAFRPLPSSNVTAPLLFRTLHERGGTLLLDEAERLRDNTPESKEIGSILLAGYKRGGRASRLESIGKEFHRIDFEVYGPKALAAINGLPPALSSRCIPVLMYRADSGSSKSKRRLEDDATRLTQLRDDLHALALGTLGQNSLSLAARNEVCPFSNRNFQLWQPLMALASFIEEKSGGKIVGLASSLEDYAKRIIEDSQEDQTPEVDEILLRILTQQIREGKTPTPGQILSEAQQHEPELFSRWTARGISEHLRRYGIRARKVDGRREYRDVTMSQLAKVKSRYRMDLVLEPDQSQSESIPQVNPTLPTRPATARRQRPKRKLNRPVKTGRIRRYRKHRTEGTVGTVARGEAGDSNLPL